MKEKKIWKWSLLLAKTLIGVSTLSFFYQAVFEDGLSADWLARMQQALVRGSGGAVGVAAALVLLNWGIEAWKWQVLSGKVEKISFRHALAGVLAGLCLGFITPNRIGDYAGRILGLHSRQRLEAIGAVFLGRFCQLGITVLLGTIGLLFFIMEVWWLTFPAISLGLGGLLVLLNLGLLLILCFPGIMLGAIGALPWLRRLLPYLAVIGRYSRAEILTVLLISALRYLVFLGQFMLLLFGFGVRVPLVRMALAVASTFLLKSVVPSFNGLTDLGMRELSAMYFFSLLDQDSAVVMSASLSLWFLNLGLPSLLGVLFVWQIRLKDVRLPKQ